MEHLVHHLDVRHKVDVMYIDKKNCYQNTTCHIWYDMTNDDVSGRLDLLAIGIQEEITIIKWSVWFKGREGRLCTNYGKPYLPSKLRKVSRVKMGRHLAQPYDVQHY
ncbi:hypothetical protein CR513_58550, partial [Mucuna pruriens]